MSSFILFSSLKNSFKLLTGINFFIVSKVNFSEYESFVSEAVLLQFISILVFVSLYSKKLYIFSSEKTNPLSEIYLELETIVDYFEPKANSLLSSKTFLNIAFTIYPYQIIYSRKYIKLQDVLGNIGGCSDILFVFFKFFCIHIFFIG